MLVILDNAREASQVRPLLPGSPGCLVVVTSRNELAGLVATEGAHPLTLDVLSDADARDLLSRRLGAARVAAEPLAVAELIGLCARLPLALGVAAARAAAQPRLQMATLAAELRDARSRLDALETGEPASNLRTVLSWSYRNLDGPAARLPGLRPGPDVTTPAAASPAAISLDDAHGLLLVDTLSVRWGWVFPREWGGKVVWAEVSAQ